ncbi:MAG: ABC transporter permease, partial [Bacteroidetes bacterium]|nr:ABC transporter permease [Bacteroidota bacterium]
MRIAFNLNLAWRSLRNNQVRTLLTVSIIALGLWALIGILTCIEVLKASVNNNFSSLGSNSFQITNETLTNKRKRRGNNINTTEAKPIKYEEARAFKNRFVFPAIVGISVSGTSVATVKIGSEKTNPNIRTIGIDENYLKITDTKLDAGRDFSDHELYSGGYVCILGNGVAKKLFKQKYKSAIGSSVSIGDVKYKVVGIAEEK